MESNPIRILVDRVTPRLAYTCGILFDLILGRPAVLVTERDCDLAYTSDAPPMPVPHIPCQGLLLEAGFRSEFPFPKPLAALPPLGSMDVLAWAFFHLSMYGEYYQHPPEGFRLQVEEVEGPEVWVEDVALQIGQALGIAPAGRGHDYAVTIDVDHPWKHRMKPLVVQAGGLLRDLLRGRRDLVAERRRALFGGDDPFEVDELMAELCPVEKTTFFYLVDGAHPRDSRFSLRQRPYARRVKALDAQGFTSGLHPSYESSDTPELFAYQKGMLEEVLGKAVLRSRQHYLRFRLPETFRDLLAAGIRSDYSLCYPHKLGARTRIVRPYPWYDLEREAVTDLQLVPAQVMDRTLQQYLKLGPEAALAKALAMLERVRAVNGYFVVILHNETFSGSGEWAGWLPFIEGLLAALEDHGS